MRLGRAKAARKTLQFFERTQGIRPPYYILLDGTFIVAVVKYNLPLFDRLDKLLQHSGFHLTVTQSSLDELESLKDGVQDKQKKEMLTEAIQWARQNCERVLQDKDFPVGRGKTDRNEEDQDESDLSRAGKDIRKWVTAAIGEEISHKATKAGHEPLHKYFVASQDEELLDFIRGTGSVPVIRLARGSVLLLEQPSKVAANQASQNERQKWTASKAVSEKERELVATVRKEQRKKQREEQRNSAPIMRRKKKAKGPNPLSCKKKKAADGDVANGQKRKRRRKSKSTSEQSQDS